jgi:ribonuclease P protein component
VSPRQASERFRRSDHLRSSKDFRRISRVGQRIAVRSFVVLVASGLEGHGMRRLGLTVSRRVGRAVARNRVRRRVREWFRRHRSIVPEGADWVVIARPGAGGLEATEVAAELEEVASRLRGGNIAS